MPVDDGWVFIFYLFLDIIFVTLKGMLLNGHFCVFFLLWGLPWIVTSQDEGPELEGLSGLKIGPEGSLINYGFEPICS